MLFTGVLTDYEKQEVRALFAARVALATELNRVASSNHAGNISAQQLVIELQQLLDAAKNVAQRDAKE